MSLPIRAAVSCAARLCPTNVEKSELPSLVKGGSREAAGGSFKKINLLINTTPALRATPPHLSSSEEGSFAIPTRHAVGSQQPVFGEQSPRRRVGAELLQDLRFAGPHHTLLE